MIMIVESIGWLSYMYVFRFKPVACAHASNDFHNRYATAGVRAKRPKARSRAPCSIAPSPIHVVSSKLSLTICYIVSLDLDTNDTSRTFSPAQGLPNWLLGFFSCGETTLMKSLPRAAIAVCCAVGELIV
jgi:hypothetical protein